MEIIEFNPSLTVSSIDLSSNKIFNICIFEEYLAFWWENVGDSKKNIDTITSIPLVILCDHPWAISLVIERLNIFYLFTIAVT